MTLRSFPFNSAKAIQAVGVLFLSESASEVSYYRLLKLLYIADRQHLKKTGRPIVGGTYVAMDAGPLHSPVYDLIKGEHPDSPKWRENFGRHSRYLQMRCDPGNDELSKSEIRSLHGVSDQLAEQDDEAIREITHSFDEYLANHSPGTATIIPVDQLIDAVGLTDRQDEVIAEVTQQATVSSIFGA